MKKLGGAGVREKELWHTEIRMRETEQSSDRGWKWEMWMEHNRKQEGKEAKAEQMDTGVMRNKCFSLYISIYCWSFLLREELRCRVNSGRVR